MARETALQRDLEILLKGLPEDLPDCYHQGYSISDHLWLTYPYDKHLIGQVMKAFKDAGWREYIRLDETHIGEGKEPKMWMQWGEWPNAVEVIIEFSTTAPGTTCKRKVIGKKEVDIIEMVCEDA